MQRIPIAQVREPIPRDAVPWVIVPFTRLRELALDHRAGFVLSFVDGRTTVETIVDVSGMPAREVVDILVRLVEARAIELRSPSR